MSRKKSAVLDGLFFSTSFVALRSTTLPMDERQLQQRTWQALEGAKDSQNGVARALDLNRSSVSRVLRNAGLKHAAVQARIVSLLEGVPV
jgi:hypothetical protein